MLNSDAIRAAFERGEIPDDVDPVPVRDDIIEDAPITGAGEVILTCFDVVVKPRAGANERQVSAFNVEITVTEDDIQRREMRVDVGFHAFIRLQVVDADNMPVNDQPAVGVALYPSTIEGPVNQQGHIDLLVPPGRYMAYLLGREERAQFDVAVGSEDGGTVTLRR